MSSDMLYSAPKQEKMKSKSFTQTCTRFSQFLKEKRSLGHLDAFKSIASLENNEFKGVAKDVSGANYGATHMLSKNMENERMSLELFPFMSSSMVNSSELPKPKEEHKNTTNNTTPSMTIFYGGKVLVFDELPEDKALEIMSLARRGTTMSSNVQIQAQTPQQLAQDVVVPQGVSSLSDLPITRKMSLHRFMEKRKHRIATSAPYQLHNSSIVHSQKVDLMRSLYDKEQLELKL